VSAFLTEFKLIMTDGRGLDVIPRQANQNALLSLGLTERNRREEILSLSVTDYCSGPKQDKDQPGSVWEFGKSVSGKEVYIKLKIAEVKGTKIAKCISFHEAAYPMIFPFRDSHR
jgi:hypothetical protein